MTEYNEQLITEAKECQVLKILEDGVIRWPARGILRNTLLDAGCRIIITGSREQDMPVDIVSPYGFVVGASSIPAPQVRIDIAMEWGMDSIEVSTDKAAAKYTWTPEAVRHSRLASRNLGRHDLYEVAYRLATLASTGFFQYATASIFPRGGGETSSFLIRPVGILLMDQGAPSECIMPRHTSPARTMDPFEEQAILYALTTATH